MARPEKVAVVEEIRTKLDESDAAVLTEYRGLTVHELAELRGVAAPDRHPVQGVQEHARPPGDRGPRASTTSRRCSRARSRSRSCSGDAAAAAKALRDFGKNHDGARREGRAARRAGRDPGRHRRRWPTCRRARCSSPRSPACSSSRSPGPRACSRRSPATSPTACRRSSTSASPAARAAPVEDVPADVHRPQTPRRPAAADAEEAPAAEAEDAPAAEAEATPAPESTDSESE